MTRKKILIVDDDRDQQQALTIRMRASGYDTTIAADGMQAVSAIRKQEPDLILLDIGLPGGDGYSVLERIKAMTPTALLPVIVLSARDVEPHRDQALAAGADAYFQKPADNEALITTIRGILGETNGDVKAA